MFRSVSAVPIIPRLALIGAGCFGAVGALAGLVRGLLAYPPTAWFAVFELGIPAAIAGGGLGSAIALLVVGARRVSRGR